MSENVQLKTLVYGQLVAALRARIPMGQVEFATLIGVSQPSVARIESGEKRNIDSYLERVICRALKVPETYLTDAVPYVLNQVEILSTMIVKAEDPIERVGLAGAMGLVVFCVQAYIRSTD